MYIDLWNLSKCYILTPTSRNAASYHDNLKSEGHDMRFNKSDPEGLCTWTLTCAICPNINPASYHDILKSGGHEMRFNKPYSEGCVHVH